MDSEPRVRVKAISAKTLTSHGYAVCLFPEQPIRRTVEEQDRAVEEDIGKTTVRELEAPLRPDFVRLYWRNRLVYLLAFIYFSLSINNIYYFPMKVYRYGLIFLVPYTIATVVIGYPLHVLQTSMGQYAQYGILWIWECAVTFFGLGVSLLLLYVLMSLYYNMFAAYSLVYFAHCFTQTFPWSYCTNFVLAQNNSCYLYLFKNYTLPSYDFFYDVVLNTPDRYPPEIWSFKSFKWWLFLALIFSWCFVYIATLRGCMSIGKIAVFSVIFSYFSILSLLVVAFCMKDGGNTIIRETKKEMNMFDIGMWSSAIMQVLLELGICYGIPMLYGSYCRFRNYILLDSMVLCSVNYINSIIFLYLFFSFADLVSCKIDDLQWKLPDNTIGIIFIIYSEAFSRLCSKQYWCSLFFLMLFLNVNGTQIAITEGIMGVIYESSNTLLQYRWGVNLILCAFFCILGILFCFSWGYFAVLMLHYIPTFFTVFPFTCLFLIGLVFIYGFKNYSISMKLMRNYNVTPIMKVFLIILLVVFVTFFTVTVGAADFIIFWENLSYYEIYTKVCWYICGIIYFPFVIFAIICICLLLYKNMKLSTKTLTWLEVEDDKKAARLQFTERYSPAYTWPWNRYR